MEQDLENNSANCVLQQIAPLSVIEQENISALDLSWDSNVENTLRDMINADLKSSTSSNKGNAEQKVDREFDNFNWNSEQNNPENVTTDFLEKGLQIDRKLSPNKRSCPTEFGGEINGLVKKPKNIANNDMALGLINMPTDIPFEDIPSRYSRPIEDVLNMTAEERVEFAEQRKRDEEKRHDENLLAARHGRLHPDNARFNQGPVVNPPPICPGTMVTFTPGGQRYEVDLNKGRPTYFRSEYNRMQYDDATIRNTRKMMSDVKNGLYLPKTLSDDIERRHIAEQKYVERLIEDVVQNLSESDEETGVDDDGESVTYSKTETLEAGNSDDESVTYSKTETLEAGNSDDESVTYSKTEADNGDDDGGSDDSLFDSEDGGESMSLSENEQMTFLEMESTLLKFNYEVTVTLHDCPSECVTQLQKINDLNLHPVMFKKNPYLLKLAKRLMEQTEFPELQVAAQYFYNKIKSLFDVPDGVQFEDFFQLEAAAFRERFFSLEDNSILGTLLSFNMVEDATENMASTSSTNNDNVETEGGNVLDVDEVDVVNVDDNTEQVEEVNLRPFSPLFQLLSDEEDRDDEGECDEDGEGDEEDEGIADVGIGYPGPNEE